MLINYSDQDSQIPEGMGILYTFESKEKNQRELFQGFFIKGEL
jgi:hypothetical protein